MRTLIRPATTLVLLLALGANLAAQDALQAYRERRYADAITITQAEIQRDPANMDAYSVLGWSLNLQRRHAEAVEWARKAWAINKADHRIAGVLAEGYYGLRQDAAAMEFYQRFVSMGQNIPGWDPRNLRDAYRDMGEIFLRQKEYHRADLAFTTAVGFDRGRNAFDPARAAALWVRLGVARENLKDYPRALKAFETAAARDSTNADAKAGIDRVKALLSP